MFKLEAVRALHGDALILHYGTAAAPRYALIDGGPAKVWDATLKPSLDALRKNNKAVPLRWVALSHVDDDHVHGLIDLFKDLKAAMPQPKDATAATAALFHNTPGPKSAQPGVASVGGADDTDPVRVDIEAELSRVSAIGAGLVQVASFRQGATLANLALELQVARNPLDGDRLLAGDVLPSSVVGPLDVTVVSPTPAILKRLIADWEAELGKGGGVDVASVETRVENLSSVVLLVESGQKKMLLTGDALDRDVIAGLEHLKLLPAGGTFDVGLLKLPHHGAQGNNHAELFERVKADNYVISADGHFGNPDPPTLELLVESEKDRAITIWLTNGPNENGNFADVLNDRFKLLNSLIKQHKAKGIKVKFPKPTENSVMVVLTK